MILINLIVPIHLTAHALFSKNKLQTYVNLLILIIEFYEIPCRCYLLLFYKYSCRSAVITQVYAAHLSAVLLKSTPLLLHLVGLVTTLFQ